MLGKNQYFFSCSYSETCVVSKNLIMWELSLVFKQLNYSASEVVKTLHKQRDSRYLKDPFLETPFYQGK